MHLFGYDMPRLHAALNELPVALVVAVLFDLGAWLTKRQSLKAAAIWLLWAGVIGAWLAVLAGELAKDVIERSPAIDDLLKKHEPLALVSAILFTGVLGWKLVRRTRLGAREELILRGLSVLGVVGILWTERVGQALIFDHAAGIDTATMRTEVVDRERGPRHRHGLPVADSAGRRPR